MQFNKRVKTMAAALALCSSWGAANAQFQARDLNGDGVIDAYYDVAQNISWLADANAYLTAGLPPATDYVTHLPVGSPGSQFPAGSMRQFEAQRWVDQLEVYGVGDWRLPNRTLPYGDSIFCDATDCLGQITWPSELRALSAALLGTSGPFVNVQNGDYFTSIQTNDRWFGLVNVLTGAEATYDAGEAYGFAWAVHAGDVGAIAAPIPEPCTYALTLAGLLAVGVATRRKRAAPGDEPAQP